MKLRNKLHSKRVVAMLLLMFVVLPAGAADIDTRLSWHQKTVLSTPVSGVITAVNVAAGALVDKGEILVQLDDRAIRENLEHARAEAERSRLLEEEAQRELDRTIELYEQTLIADHEKQLAIIAHADAQANHKAAKAALVQAQLELEYSAVRAPYDAVVVRQFAHVGQTIISRTEVTPLLEVAERGKMSATVSVSGGTAGRLKIGAKARVQAGGKDYQGVIESIGLEPVSGKSNQYEVQVTFPTQGRVLRAGQSAKVLLP